MKSVAVRELRKYLKELSKKELEDEIVHLFKNFPSVKEYYSSMINPELNKDLLEKYKKIIMKEFTVVNYKYNISYKACRDAIKSFNKVCNQKDLVAELMFYYAEVGIEFTKTYGDINEQFYVNIASAYEKALFYVFDNDIEDDLKDKAYYLMEKGQGIGWGFSDWLEDLYYNYYQDDEL